MEPLRNAHNVMPYGRMLDLFKYFNLPGFKLDTIQSQPHLFKEHEQASEGQ